MLASSITWTLVRMITCKVTLALFKKSNNLRYTCTHQQWKIYIRVGFKYIDLQNIYGKLYTAIYSYNTCCSIHIQPSPKKFKYGKNMPN